MLFVLDSTGTPSIARWVLLGTPPAAPASPAPAPPAPPAQPSKPKLPKVRARVVHRNHHRYVELRVAKASKPRARIRLRLLNRHHHTRRQLTVTVRTGRTTILRSRPLARQVRSVKATVRSLSGASH